MRMMEKWRTEGRRVGGWRYIIYIALLVIVLCIKTREAVPVVSDNGAMVSVTRILLHKFNSDCVITRARVNG